MTISQPIENRQNLTIETNQPADASLKKYKTPPSALFKDELVSVDPTISKPYKPSKPELPPPEYALLNTLEKLHASGAKLHKTQMQALNDLTEKIERLNAENLEKLKESAKQSQESGIWDLLKKIGSCILSALSIVFGISLIATGAGAVLGGLLIASGVLSIANLALSETGTWDWVAEKLAGENEDLRKNLAIFLPAGASLLCGALGIASIGASGGALWEVMNTAEKILTIVQVGVNIAEGITTIGKGISDTKVFMSKAELTRLEAQLSLNQRSLENLANSIEKVMKNLNRTANIVANIIKLSAQSNKKIASPV